jgi:hypothetical protein
LETNELIDRLSADLGPVRRLRPPYVRLLLWLLLVVPYAAAMVYLFRDHADPGLAEITASPRYFVEQAAALLTAATAAYAAFSSLVPGHNRRVFWLPVLPLAVWLASIGQGCVEDWLRFGPSGLAIRPDTACLYPGLLIGIVPALTIAVMLRRGAPLMPRITVALGGVAVAGLVNFVLQLFHGRDLSIMVLVWHVGFLVVAALLAGWIGPRLIAWRRPSLKMSGAL